MAKIKRFELPACSYRLCPFGKGAPICSYHLIKEHRLVQATLKDYCYCKIKSCPMSEEEKKREASCDKKEDTK